MPAGGGGRRHLRALRPRSPAWHAWTSRAAFPRARISSGWCSPRTRSLWPMNSFLTANIGSLVIADHVQNRLIAGANLHGDLLGCSSRSSILDLQHSRRPSTSLSVAGSLSIKSAGWRITRSSDPDRGRVTSSSFILTTRLFRRSVGEVPRAAPSGWPILN